MKTKIKNYQEILDELMKEIRLSGCKVNIKWDEGHYIQIQRLLPTDKIEVLYTS